MPEGTSVMFDFGGVVEGYCSDFGRTIYCGNPPDDYREVVEAVRALPRVNGAAPAVYGKGLLTTPSGSAVASVSCRVRRIASAARSTSWRPVGRPSKQARHAITLPS